MDDCGDWPSASCRSRKKRNVGLAIVNCLRPYSCSAHECSLVCFYLNCAFEENGKDFLLLRSEYTLNIWHSPRGVWRTKWQPTPVFMPGKSQGQRSLVGYSLWGRKELDTTERLNATITTMVFFRLLKTYLGLLHLF